MAMERREFVALLGAATALLPSSAIAQPPFQGLGATKLIGAWSFSGSINIRKDGSKFDRWGANPKGIFIFDRGGNYAQILMGSESKVFGSKVFCAFGTFTLDESKNVLTTRVAGCSV